jgi:hypothetical protein
MAILGELDHAGKLDTSLPTVYSETLSDALDEWDIMRKPSAAVSEFYKSGPVGIQTQTAFSQSVRPHDGRRSMQIAAMAASAPMNMLLAKRAVLRFYTVILRKTAVLLKQPRSMIQYLFLKALPTSPNRNRRQWKIY